MSLRLEMLQVARLAPALLGEASELVEKFVRSQQAEDGGFFDRDGKSDLYYTSFAIDALTALQVELPAERVRGYLELFGEGDGLDFVHQCCLARCWSAIEKGRDGIGAILERLENYRAGDGGTTSLRRRNLVLPMVRFWLTVPTRIMVFCRRRSCV